MLDTSLKEQLKQIFSGLDADYVFDITVHPLHPDYSELKEFLEETASCSSKINVKVNEVTDDNKTNLSFRILKNGNETGITFKAIPNGHEFSSLILAVLNADGKGKNHPDEAIARRIERLNQSKDEIRTYMSLTCTNCPDVVQALNLIALYNKGIKHIVIDGAMYQEEAERMNIQAVPAVYIGNRLLHVGRSTLGELVEKLEDALGSKASDEEIFFEEKKFDILIAGGGPAGTSAAIYSARKGLKVGLVAGRIGGQVNETVGIENLISVPYTTGKGLASNLGSHIKEYPNISVYSERTIEKLYIEEGIKKLSVKGGEVFSAPSLIIATGASWRKLNVPGESEYIGKGVAFCPHCDGPFYKGKDVAVIGGGNSGIEAAIDLSGICSSVTVLEFMDTLKADKVLQEKLLSLPNVNVMTSVQTLSVEGNSEKMNSLKLKDRKTENVMDLKLDGVFVQIGLSANSKPFADILETNRIGEIITIDNNCRTGIKGIYAAGDVSNVSYKQIIISMGEGAKAALAAFDDIVRGENI